MEDKLLEVRDLSVAYKTDLETVSAVNGISFSIQEGQVLGIVGETGAGKTTTALSIMQLLPERISQTHGEILFRGKSLFDMQSEEIRNIRGKKISMIFQDPMSSLNPVEKIGNQIAEMLELHNEDRLSRNEIDLRVDNVLTMVGISPNRKNDYPHQFSGGMKQRVVIAMALMCEPDLIIADEPTTALDVTVQAKVLTMIQQLQERLHTSMILISHSLGIIARMCDQVAVMYAGRIIEMGRVEDIFDMDRPHHPYTLGLFGSIPNLKHKSRRLTPIDGLMPDPTDLPPGCSFAPRCSHCIAPCNSIQPVPIPLDGETHTICCHLFGGAAHE